MYLLRPATGFVTSVHFFRMQMFATCNGELHDNGDLSVATVSPFCYDQQRKMLQRPIIFAGTSQSPARRSCIHGVRGRDPSMASADGEAASMASAASGAASMASADLRRARAAELHPWRARFLGKHGRPARAPTGDEGAAVVLQARPFSREV